MRLHVGEIRTEQLLCAVDRELFRDVDEFATAVIPLARVHFRVLVGEHRTLRLEHPGAGVVLGGNQLDVVFLALALVLESGVELGIESTNGHRGSEHGSGLGWVVTGGANCKVPGARSGEKDRKNLLKLLKFLSSLNWPRPTPVRHPSRLGRD